MIQRLENLCQSVATAALMALCLLITVGIFSRAFFAVGLPDAMVLVQELMVAAIMLPLAVTTREDQHVSVELLSSRLPPNWQRQLIRLGLCVGLLALLPLIYASAREFIHTWQSGAFYYGDLQWPKWPGRLLFCLGCVLCWVRLLCLLFKPSSEASAQ